MFDIYLKVSVKCPRVSVSYMYRTPICEATEIFIATVTLGSVLVFDAPYSTHVTCMGVGVGVHLRARPRMHVCVCVSACLCVERERESMCHKSETHR